ncbi:carbon-nitrogen hydrolase family protein [Candidatus Oleimmundimicrobium sp.]|uniref:carbon-nitrogen hydrolase family protein n=1 Tax=Candidatus Oleimmundimicrobium sp. TaxID=3060597 RepID=UPI002722A5F1|nr:carbon-nitrogen hydrolase family protein [Candidatus Oleimmundimicrobium sp.]MDO8886429.1 carbon-nitrogen hydrolase family protein [Candidatus Oleimmundimicrobium sp.]
MKLVIVQRGILDDFDENLSCLAAKIKEAAGSGAEMVCLSEYFAGKNISVKHCKRIIEFLSQLSSKYKIDIVTGNFLFSQPNGTVKEVSAVINKKGKVAGLQKKVNSYLQKDEEKNKELVLITSNIGKIIILSQLDAFDDSLEEQLINLEPDLILMQFSPVSLLELEAIKGLALSRSLGETNVVVGISLIGEDNGDNYIGNSFVAFQGEIVAEASDKECVMIVEIDSSRFFKYKNLKETVILPELLKQKFEHERHLRSGI